MMKKFLLVLLLASFSLRSASDRFPSTIDKACLLSLSSGEKVKVSGFFYNEKFVLFSIEKTNGSTVTPESLGNIVILIQEALKEQGFSHQVEADRHVLNYLFENIEFNKTNSDSSVAPLINFCWRP